jgi:hypothetical protein
MNAYDFERGLSNWERGESSEDIQLAQPVAAGYADGSEADVQQRERQSDEGAVSPWKTGATALLPNGQMQAPRHKLVIKRGGLLYPGSYQVINATLVVQSGSVQRVFHLRRDGPRPRDLARQVLHSIVSKV